MKGVSLCPLRIVPHPLGDVYHGMKASDPGNAGFGEAYFSTVKQGLTKGWKKHTRMTMNLVVPQGSIRIVLHDDQVTDGQEGGFLEVTLGPENYQRLTVEPGIWMAFRGEGEGTNLLLNIASLEHDPGEAVDVALDEIPYDWSAQGGQ